MQSLVIRSSTRNYAKMMRKQRIQSPVQLDVEDQIDFPAIPQVPATQFSAIVTRMFGQRRPSLAKISNATFDLVKSRLNATIQLWQRLQPQSDGKMDAVYGMSSFTATVVRPIYTKMNSQVADGAGIEDLKKLMWNKSARQVAREILARPAHLKYVYKLQRRPSKFDAVTRYVPQFIVNALHTRIAKFLGLIADEEAPLRVNLHYFQCQRMGESEVGTMVVRVRGNHSLYVTDRREKEEKILLGSKDPVPFDETLHLFCINKLNANLHRKVVKDITEEGVWKIYYKHPTKTIFQLAADAPDKSYESTNKTK